jgi:hypothetical protein
MIKKRNVFVLICFIALLGCGNSQNSNSNKDFKNYFFQPDWFEVPKIYEYEVSSTTNDSKYKMYRYFEKLDDNKLLHIIYDKDFNQTMIITYKYLKDKVVFEESITVEGWNNNNQVKERFTDKVVFDYSKMNENFGFTHTSRQEGYSDMIKYVTRNLRKTETREFNNKEVDVVVADGKTKVVVNTGSESIEIHNNEILVYANNIGVLYQEIRNENFEAKIKLTQILSEAEFENMKNAR